MNPSIGNLGPAGVRARMSELKARMDLLRPQNQTPIAGAPMSGMSGNIGIDGYAPMPINAPGVEVAISGAPDNIQAMIVAAANKNGIDPKLFEALVWQESSFNPLARSSKGAMGLTQLMPATAQALGVDPSDPAQNLDGGARYLSQLMKRFNGVPELALAAYNAGPSRVQQANGIPNIRETQDYVKRIMDRWRAAP